MIDETIGQRLRHLRQKAGLSQRELAEPGASYAYISRIEAGTRNPSVKALRKLAPKLHVPVEYLETGEWPATGLYLLKCTSAGTTETYALYNDETEADEQAAMLNAIVRGFGVDAAPDDHYIDTLWEVDFVPLIDVDVAAEIAEQHATEPIAWEIRKPEEATTAA